MTDDGEDISLSPYERETVAWMEAELDRDPDADPPGHAGRPGLMPLAGGSIAAFGVLVAFTATAPLALAGWILLLIGFTIVWERSG